MAHMPPDEVIAHLESILAALDRIDVQSNVRTGEIRTALQALGAHLACSPPVDYDGLERCHKQDGFTNDQSCHYKLGWDAACDVLRIHTDPT